MTHKNALIIGSNGQTGSYLLEKLLNDTDVNVFGTIRKASTFNTERIDHLMNNPRLRLEYGDLGDSSNINHLVQTIKPDYIFNLGSISHVATSFSMPIQYGNVDGLGTARVLEAARLFGGDQVRVLQASTSELFGLSYDLIEVEEKGQLIKRQIQSEQTKMIPQSPYGCSKLYSYFMVQNYRSAYNLFAVNSISFNHESPRRNPTFASRKIIQGLVRCSLGLQDKLVLGNTQSFRSFNHVRDICDGMWLMMNADKPDDYVIGDNPAVSIQEFAEIVAKKLNVKLSDFLSIDNKYFRPLEVPFLQPDASKIKRELGWSPKYSLDMLIDEMIEHDLKLAKS